MYHTCEEQKIEDPSSSEGTMYYTEQIAVVEEVHRIGSKAKFHTITVNGHIVRMQINTASSVTNFSKNIWWKSSFPTFSTSPRRIETYDGHRVLYFGHRKCEIPWEKQIHSVDVAVIEFEREFGLIGRNVTRVESQNGHFR